MVQISTLVPITEPINEQMTNLPMNNSIILSNEHEIFLGMERGANGTQALVL